MTKRFLLSISLFAVAVGLAPVGPAHAGAYPPGCATVVTNDAVVDPATQIQITASGYTSIGATITFYLIVTSADHSEGAVQVGTAIVQADGTASITITAPTTFGSYDIIAVGGNCEDALTSFTVGRFPPTGSDANSWLQTAILLVVLGTGFALVAVRRKQQEPAAA